MGLTIALTLAIATLHVWTSSMEIMQLGAAKPVLLVALNALAF